MYNKQIDQKRYPEHENHPVYKWLKQFSTSKHSDTNDSFDSDSVKSDNLPKDDDFALKEAKSDKKANPKSEEESKENNKQSLAEQQDKDKVASTSWKEMGWHRDYEHLSEVDKLKMKVDEIFALYLYHVSKRTNKKFYFHVLRFVMLFRECLNEIGW